MKIEELKVVVAAMSEAPWSPYRPSTDDSGWPTGTMVAATARGQGIYSPSTRGTMPASDRHGIATLRNHADALVDLASAAAQRRDARCWSVSEHEPERAKQCWCGDPSAEGGCPIRHADLAIMGALSELEAIP